MNVSCTSCSAKYAIPDEKVRGKKVKITCKHCGTGIIVDGTKIDAADAGEGAPAAAPTASAAASPAAAKAAPTAAVAPAVASPQAPAPAAATELSFDIAYPDDRQETLSVSQIVDKYAAGTLDDLAFLWREGMSDWKAPFEIPELASALSARGLKKAAAPLAAPAASGFVDDDEATKIQDSPFEGMMTTAEPDAPGAWREPGKEPPSSPQAAFDLRASAPLPFEESAPVATPAFAAASPKPAAVAASPKPAPAAVAVAPKAEAPKPTAARRSAARGGGDLFGDLAGAGSEEDESLGTDAKDAAPKLTGARNESSVLFSLDALVKQEQKPAAKKPSAAKQQDDAAAILMGTDSSPNSIANVGTGSFGSAFAAPDFNAPVLAPPPEVRAADPASLTGDVPAKKKGMGLWIAIAAVVAIGGGAVAAGLPAKLAGAPPPAPTPSAAPAAVAPTPAAVAPSPEATAATSASAVPAASAAPVAAVGGAATTAPAGATPATPTAAKPGEATPKPSETAAKPVEKPAEKPAEAAASDAPPFDKAAAIAALSAAAGNAQSCKTPDGPSGSGKVSITFMPSGRATNTQVSGDLAGTAVGGCVAKLFRSAKVPAFSGDAVTVSKSFSVQ
ncbi:MAG: zinc-ribbon domain-containing protein [Myxococcales bacterium]